MKALIIAWAVGWLGLLAFAAFVIHEKASPWWFVGVAVVFGLTGYNYTEKKSGRD